ncbi:SRPBCC family protein [Oceanobacillus damuensis]|uniref:SRPBCC family protein n=1 Tax=Oceanobacillus damuensis TaxID=937928 RepID=UPI00083035E9|nr:SRPBCC family protein [Oceanobacillus damuensis]
MVEYGTLHHETDGKYTLKFERFFAQQPEEVFNTVIHPEYFPQWYPFATGDMDHREGGEITFDDGEGSTYAGIITKFVPPYVFAFREVKDLLSMEFQSEDKGCRLIFKHTFDNQSMTVRTAAGWHRCLDALGILVNGKEAAWPDNGAELREAYEKAFAT